MMKQVHAVVFGVGAFFAMNCGSGESDYPEPSSGRGTTAAETTQPPPAGSDSTPSSPSSASSDGRTVKVIGHDFEPAEIRIKAGEKVTWTWVSGSHNVVSGARCAPDGKFTSGASTSSPPSTFEHTFDAPGTYPYFCDPHCGLGMTGTVVVE